MQCFLVGLAMQSYTHDYSMLHSVLFEVEARRVSGRIWLITVGRNQDDLFKRLEKSLAPQDGLLIVEMAGEMRRRSVVGTALH